MEVTISRFLALALGQPEASISWDFPNTKKIHKSFGGKED